MTDTQTKPESGSELERIEAATVAVTNKPISWKDLAAILAPAPQALPVPKKVPLPRKITDEQAAALLHLVDVYGQVTVDTRRALTVDELRGAADEKATWVVIKKMGAERDDDLRTMFFNHADVIFERDTPTDQRDEVSLDKDGHYVAAYEEPVPGTTRKLTRQVTKGSPTISESKLHTMAEDDNEPDISHQDWLAMTSPVRVFDEAKAMAHLKRHPELLKSLAKAAVTSPSTPSFWLR